MSSPTPRIAGTCRRLLSTAALCLSVALAVPALAQPAPAEAAPGRGPMSPREMLIEYAGLRGVIDRCTRTPNQIDFLALIEAVVRAERYSFLDELSGRSARLRAELQAGVNLAYGRAMPAGQCGSASDLVVQAGRADALAGGLGTVLSAR